MGEERTTYFFFDQQLIAAYMSYITALPSPVTIGALSADLIRREQMPSDSFLSFVIVLAGRGPVALLHTNRQSDATDKRSYPANIR